MEAIISSDHYVVDDRTGEVILRITPNKTGAKRYGFVGGYILMGMFNITKLRQIKMPATGYALALLLVERAGYGGVYQVSFSELAEEIGVQRPAISKLMAVLERNRLVKRVGGKQSSAIVVNPSFAFRGTPTEHQSALVKWAELHPLALVPKAGQDRQSA